MVNSVSPVRLFEGIEHFGTAAALVCEDGVSISYAELAERADAAAKEIGPARALVTIEMQNDLEPIVLYIGLLRAGHVVIPKSSASTSDSTEAPFAPNAGYSRTSGNWQFITFNRDEIAMAPDLAILLSTSGSTGSQKLVRLSHENLRSNALAIADYLELAPGERAITSLPAHYSFGLSVLHTHLLLGHTVVLEKRSVSETGFWEKVERERVTSIAGVPHTFHMLELGGFLGREYPDLRYLTQAGGKLPADRVRLFAQWAERSGKRFYVMYGQTEASPRIAYLPPADTLAYADCIGIAIPGGALRLEEIDASAGLPAGAGELVYKGPNVMMGYALSRADLAKPQGSDEIRTGDVAVCNERGYYRIVGRLSRFAKLFGLRLGFDDIELRLAAAGIAAAVSGDDTGIVVATTQAGASERVPGLLADELGIPAALISAVEVDEIPRLPSGKTDYAGIRSLGRKPPVVVSSSLAASIGVVLNQVDLDQSLSFSELGGDSLNYVQMVLTLEGSLGYVPDNWENTPIGELAALEKRTNPGVQDKRTTGDSISFQGLDLARSIAILLALMSHAATQVGLVLTPEVSFLARLATPILIVLFGLMIPLLYVPRAAHSDPRGEFQQYLTKSLQCYFLYAVNVLAIWMTAPSGWLYAFGSLALLGAMPYAQILVFYIIMFLFIPAILFALKRVHFGVLFAGALVVHIAFVPLKMVPDLPLLAGQPIPQRLLDLFVGAGANPHVAGPSILHSLVLLLAGCWIGSNIRLSAETAAPRLRFLGKQAGLAAIFAVGIIYAFQVPDHPVDWEGLASFELRNLNHPAYIFVYGAICILLLSILLVSGLSARAPNWLMTIGRRSLFGFGIGNAVIAVWPVGGLPFFTPLFDAAALLLFLVLLIHAFDYCMRTGREGHIAVRWVFDVTSWGSRAISGLAGVIVQMFSRNPPGYAAKAARRAASD